ncbi:uncharacterized protein LOC130980676 [Arachis stenosperma]|uniref:uncharacterized protein LOC130980676 n=1 Tax=Arachis stenosperma TaxID=217475 RepID=UPI0025AC5E2E|nr:uncharacterized protein LOC130980676 [Arachis stenosperma]
MNNPVDLVEKITPWRESWKVHVKVVKLWYQKNTALDPSQNLLHMVLMDEKLHKIQATIRDELISKFAVSLNEGDLYLITNFTVLPNSVLPNSGLNRVTKHRFRLLFQYKTSVVSVVSPRITHSGLCFTSIDEIDQMTKDHNFLIGKKVQCNVFGNACDLLEYENLQKYPRSPLIVLESFKIKAIEGGVILQNVINISRLFINPDIPESVEFLSRFSDAHYFVMGTIKEVMDEPDWWYYSCVCGHPVVDHEDLYLCDACCSCVEHVMLKYRIRVKVHHAGCDVCLFCLIMRQQNYLEKPVLKHFSG